MTVPDATPRIYFSFLEAQRSVIPYFFFALSSANGIVNNNIANKKYISFREIMVLMAI